MNVVRRLFLAVYSLVFLAAVGGVIALAWNQDEQLDLNIGDLNMQALINAGDNAKYALTAVLAGLAVIGLITLLIALWPKRSGYDSKGTLRIRQSDGGTVEVSATAIESLLRTELQALPEVRTAEPKVKLAGGAVDTYVEANIEPSVSIANATKLLSGTIDQVLREHVGVTAIRRPVVRITYDEMGVRPVGSVRIVPDYQPGAFPPEEPPREMSPATQMKPPATVSEQERPPEEPVYTSTTQPQDEEQPHDDRS
jgi:hypothetical protein